MGAKKERFGECPVCQHDRPLHVSRRQLVMRYHRRYAQDIVSSTGWGTMVPCDGTDRKAARI